jgi:hypothetical protein
MMAQNCTPLHTPAPAIEWLERLDEDRAGQSKGEGCVFKVRIESQLYALKVVSRSMYNPITGGTWIAKVTRSRTL